MIDHAIFEAVMNRACAELYRDNRRYVDERAHERTIVADFLAPYLRQEFADWNVNTDYNREGPEGDRRPKTDSNGNRIMPDIVIHRRGNGGPNAVAVQVKGYWNQEDRSIDEGILRRLQTKHGYRLLYRLELGEAEHELISVT